MFRNYLSGSCICECEKSCSQIVKHNFKLKEGIITIEKMIDFEFKVRKLDPPLDILYNVLLTYICEKCGEIVYSKTPITNTINETYTN